MSQYIIDILKIENKSWIEDFYYTNDDKSSSNDNYLFDDIYFVSSLQPKVYNTSAQRLTPITGHTFTK